MVALDDGAGTLVRDGFDYVRVQGALRQKVHLGQLFGFFVENFNEGVADDLALLFGVIHARKFGKKTFLRLHKVEVEVKVFAQVADYFVAFAKAQQAVIHKDAVQTLADGLVEQHGHHGGINAAGKGAYHVAVAYLFGHFGNHALHKRRHGPVGLDARNLEQEVAQHALAVHTVVHFGVELHGVDFAGFVSHSGHI